MSFIDLPVNKKGRTYRDSAEIENDLTNMYQSAIGDSQVQFEHCGQTTLPVLKNSSSLSRNGFLWAVHNSFANEIPLVLTPDHFWTLILQGVAEHVNQNPQKFHEKMVKHAAGTQKEIEIRNDQLRKRSKNSPWNLCFPMFEKALDENIVGGNDPLLPKFSTSNETTRIGHVIAMMDVVKSYFTFKVCTMCGIPRITLLGNAEDWNLLYSSTEALLKRVEMTAWWDKVCVILRNCTNLVCCGIRDVAFWSQMYMHCEGDSGEEDTVTGWLTHLFPYILADESSTQLSLNNFASRALVVTAFPSSINCVPFEWNYYGSKSKMNFYAGIVGVGLCSDGKSVSPAVGWAVAYQKGFEDPESHLFQNGILYVKSVDDLKNVISTNSESFVLKISPFSRTFMVELLTGGAADQDEQDEKTQKRFGVEIFNNIKTIRSQYRITTPNWQNKVEIEFEKNLIN